MELTHDDVRKILQIIDEAEHLEELDLTYGALRLHVRRRGEATPAPRAETSLPAGAAPAQAATATPAPARAPILRPATTQSVPEGMVAIRAPMLGTFYRAPSPGEKPFVEVGQRVKAEDTVCLIEVMKLFNSIRAGVDGKVAQILVDNAGLVEFNQVLLLIEPARKK